MTENLKKDEMKSMVVWEFESLRTWESKMTFRSDMEPGNLGGK